MATKTMNPTLGDLLKREYEPHFCREAVTIKSGATHKLGEVLALQAVDPTAANVTVAAGAGNTGNGTFTKDATTPVQAGAVAGDYTVTITEAVTNSGRFVVRRPDGTSIGTGVVGTAFSGEIKFSLADGATDFVVGDTWTVTVPAGDNKAVLCLNASQNNGTHLPYGILLQDVDATSADVSAVVLRRGPATVSAAQLIWDATVNTTAKKAAKLKALEALGIVSRTAA